MLISFSCIRGSLIFDVQIRPSNICRNTRLTKEGRRCTGRLLSWQRGRSDAPALLGKPARHAALGFCRKRWRAPQTPASPSPAPSSHTTGWAHASPAAGKRDLLPPGRPWEGFRSRACERRLACPSAYEPFPARRLCRSPRKGRSQRAVMDRDRLGPAPATGAGRPKAVSSTRYVIHSAEK